MFWGVGCFGVLGVLGYSCFGIFNFSVVKKIGCCMQILGGGGIPII
jgi:hypothetical protein